MRSVVIAVSFLMLFSSCRKDDLNLGEKPIAWMSYLLDKYPEKDIKFSDILLPGSHDAGMYMLRNCSVGANACNTQTQHLNMKRQLAAGYRYFDIRPTILGENLFTYHFNECGGLGCYGDRLDNIFSSIQEFIETHREVVIIHFSNFCKVNPDDEVFLEMIDTTFGENLYRETRRVENLYDWSLQDVLGDNGKGKVVLMFNVSQVQNTDEFRKKGYFNSNIINVVGGWSNKNEYGELKKDQLKNYNMFQPRPPYLFEFSWQMTHNALDAVNCVLSQDKSILEMAKISNPDFEFVIDSMIHFGAINSQKIPNFFWVDYGEKWMRDVAVKVSEVKIKN